MKKNFKIMVLMGIFVFLSSSFFNSNIFDELDYNSKNGLKNNGFWDLTETPIYIDNTDPAFNWSKTVADNEWCSGSGTWSDPYLIENVTIDGVFEGSCIYIENSDVPFIIKNCTLVNIGRGANPNYDAGVRLKNVSRGLILDNNCSNNNGRGIHLRESNNNTISYNIANNNERTGLYIVYSSNNNTINNNTFNYNLDGGIYIYECNFNNFTGNTISQTVLSLGDWSSREIELTGYGNYFSGNIFNNCGIHLRQGSLNHTSSHIIDNTNLVNGKPLYYYVKKQFLTNDNFSNAGQVILVACNKSVISNLTISNGGSGISLYYCSNNTIFNNTVKKQYREEIFLSYCYQNKIFDNNITNIGTSTGIFMRDCYDNNISANQITDCSTAIEISTYLAIMDEYSNGNNITENLLYGNGVGIYSSNSINNTIKENHILYNIYAGIRDYGENNTFYLNQFIGNTLHAEDYGETSYWDNGSIGNYWDNYTGEDANDDGIGETPYLVPGQALGSQDNFPIWDDGHNGSKIIIDDSSSNNWIWASKHSWCSGSGTETDPYIIFKVKINGSNTGNGISIRNSNVHFRIENSTVYNSQADYTMFGGIKLDNVDNGVLIFNNCSNNNGNAILLDNCNNITIKENVMNNNGMTGATILGSHYNNMINNKIYNNERAFWLSNSYNNEILKNTLVNNYDQSIRLSQAYFNKIKRNSITGGYMGIRITGYNNTVSENELYSNMYGIYLANGVWTENNTVANNSIHDNSYGIHLDGANCRYNMFYNNTLMNNGLNAFDDGHTDYFDNGIIGNYWDDYVGEDANDDGIGDTPYNITGLAESKDNFPIWYDGHNGSKIVIDDESWNNWTWAETREWCSGSGTFNDPYIIKDLVINGRNASSCILIENSNVFFRIENCTVFNSSSVTFTGGIKFNHVKNGHLLDNNCSNNNRNGIIINYSSNNTISDNIIENNHNNSGAGIWLHDYCENNTISDNEIYNNWMGIYLSISSNNNTIVRNNATYNSNHGIYVYFCDNNNISNNIASYNWHGIYLTESENSTISGNTASFNNWYGMYLTTSSHNNTILKNNASNNNIDGIRIYFSNNNTIIGNTVSYNTIYGLYLYNSDSSSVTGNILYGNFDDIHEIDCSYNIFKWNVENGFTEPILIDNNGGGDFTWAQAINKLAWIYGSGTLVNPFIIEFIKINGQNSSSCIEIRDSNAYFRIENCIVFNSSPLSSTGGIVLNNVKNGYLMNNTCSNNNRNGIILTYSNNNIISGNLIENNHNNSGAGIWLSNYCENNTVSDNKIYNNWMGIYLSISSNNNTIVRNNATYNSNHGIYIYHCDENNISNNIASYNWHGIYLTQSENSTISGNTASFNNWHGILLVSSSHNNNILKNDVSNNINEGISIWFSHNNTIIGNIVSNNSNTGIYLYNSNSTLIYNNTFHENILNAEDNGMYNLWDNGVIGNYWSDYNGKDINDNGIGDTPFVIAGIAGSQDNLPIWWDAPAFSILSPVMDEEFKTIAPSYEISISEGIVDTMWYTLNNGSTNQTFLSLNGVINQVLWNEFPSGFVTLRFTVNDSRGYSSFQEVNILKILGYTILSPFIIDDIGGGDYTWNEAVQEHWCQGSGTSIDPYIIESIKIDGQNSGSCLTIRFSQVYFTLLNCTFYNSGNINNAGIKLINVTNGRLHLVNSSFNNGHGILLEFCEYISITSSSINNNTLNGIFLIDCSYVNILDNTNTINSNSESGVYLLRSHDNEISDNTIRYNSVGINLDQSDYNLIERNNLLGNGKAYIDLGVDNIIGDSNMIPDGTEFQFPFEPLLIILIVGIIAIGIAGSVIIRKRLISSRELGGKKEISKQKKEKVLRKLEEKLKFVDYLIKESNYKLAYKNLGKVKDTSDKYELMAIFNRAVKKTKFCQDVEAGISKVMITEDLTKPVKEKKEKKVKEKVKSIPDEKIEVKEEIVIAPVIEKEDRSKYSLFISYSTSDRDYFQIKRIERELKKYPQIKQVSYWERDSKANIVEFMEETLDISNTFILFCTETSMKSKAVKDEWQAAFQMRKQDLIKIIPVYEEQNHIPKLLWHLLNVKYTKEDFDGFIQNLYNEIIR